MEVHGHNFPGSPLDAERKEVQSWGRKLGLGPAKSETDGNRCLPGPQKQISNHLNMGISWRGASSTAGYQITKNKNPSSLLFLMIF